MKRSAPASSKSLLFAAFVGCAASGIALSTSAQIAPSTKAGLANPAQAHVTVVGESAVQQGQKAHEKLEGADEPLSHVQLQRLAANARIYKEKVRPLQTELCKSKRHLNEILTEEDLSVPNAQVLQTKIGQLKTEIRDLQLKKQLADSQVLTANQRKALRLPTEHHLALNDKPTH